MGGKIMDIYSNEEKKELLELARNTIKHHLDNGKEDLPETDNIKFQEKRGVFVSLHKKGQLRGCIGYPLPIKPLYQAIVDNAISAAFEDPRFPAVKAKELKDIDIEISVLTVPRVVAEIDDVRLGRDGIIISKGFHKGLLLPQVPIEQGWSLEEYIYYGCQKAGLSGDEWRSGVTIETFSAIVFSENDLMGEGNGNL